MFAFINCKHKECLYQNKILDPKRNMVHVAQKWIKIAKYLQVKIKSNLSINGNMCKDKWNSIHNNYKKIYNYHKGTGNNTSY